MSDKICMHCFVSGKVQGVWFRASTKEKADSLGIVGWAKNLPDGRVEVIAGGEVKAIKALYTWLQQGPPMAQVKDVSYEELPWQSYTDFSTQ